MSSTSIVYRLLFATLAALGMTSLVALSLRVTLAGIVLGAPGWPIAIIFSAASHSDSALIFPVSVFSGYFFLALAFWKPPDSQIWRQRLVLLTILVAALLVLASMPRLDPLIPKGMTALRKQEADLTFQLADKSTLTEVRQVLEARRIEFREETEHAEIELLSNKNVEISASAGDSVLFNHLVLSDVNPNAGAYQFPCRYDLQFILVFGQDEKLKQRYIEDSRLCP